MRGTLSTADGQPFNTGSVALFIFDAEDWGQYAEEVTCMDRARLAKSRFSIGDKGGAEASAQQELEASYRISKHAGSFTFSRDIKPEDGVVLYVVIADCSLEQIFHQLPPINYEVEFLNGDSHIPAEEYGLQTVYLVLLVGLLVAGGVGHKLVQEQRTRLEALPLITKMLLVAYVLNLASTTLEALLLYWYGAYGTQWGLIDTMAELLQAVFTSLVSFVLLALACGWTLTEDSSGAAFVVALRDPAALMSCRGMTPSAALVLLFTASFVVVELVDLMTTSRDNDFAKFHEHDSPAGRLLMLMQVIFCGLFFFSLNHTRSVVPPRVKDFLKTLALGGAAWFLVTPMLVFMAPAFAKIQRHRIVTAGVVFLQSAALVLMCRLFLTRQSDYSKLSSIGNLGTFMGLESSRGAAGGKAID